MYIFNPKLEKKKLNPKPMLKTHKKHKIQNYCINMYKDVFKTSKQKHQYTYQQYLFL